MKIKDLIKELQKFDPELKVVVKDEIEGNDDELKLIEMGKFLINKSKKYEDCLLIRW